MRPCTHLLSVQLVQELSLWVQVVGGGHESASWRQTVGAGGWWRTRECVMATSLEEEEDREVKGGGGLGDALELDTAQRTFALRTPLLLASMRFCGVF